MAKPKSEKNTKITTIKLNKETKLRLDHFKEFGRESYDELMKKILYILNILRSNPEAASGILKNIDLKLKRKQVYTGIIREKSEETRKINEKPEISSKPQIKPNQKIIPRINQKIIRK